MGELIASLGGAGSLTAGGLLGIAILSIIRGWLVPSPFYRDLQADRDRWQTAAEKATEANTTLLQQNGKLIEQGRTTQKVLQSLPPGDQV